MKINEFHNTTISDLLDTQAAQFPDRPFLRLGDRVLTYHQTNAAVTRVAAGLQALGVQPGARLAVILPNIPEFVMTLFAAARAGLILVPINVRRHQTEVFTRMARTRPAALVTGADLADSGASPHLEMANELQERLPDLQHIISLEAEGSGLVPWKELLESEAAPAPPAIRPADPALIVHTLGSSGTPRGAILTHQGMVRNAASIAAALHCTPEDVFLGTVPFSNAFGLTPTILTCVVAGAELVCLPKYSPGEALNLISKYGVTVHHGVPTMFALELNHPGFSPKKCTTLRTGIMSGAPCPPELTRRVRDQMGCHIQLAYGLTEASPSVTMTRLDDGPVTASETVGRPHEGIELKVIDSEGHPLPPGEEGELCVRGYNVMVGYWDALEATAQVLDDEGWLHTGDLAVIDPDGPVRIKGRLDEIINRGGFKVSPGPIEMVLRSFPGVKDAAVVGIPDLIYGELPTACVVRRPGEDFSAQSLLEYAAGHLADYAVPDRVLFFDALPRRGSGPIQKDYLRERVRIHGQAWKFGNNVDTDAIIPARRCNTADPRELALFCMEDADPEFVNQMHRGDLIVAGNNFGCGSSREVAPLSIKAAGVSAVIAKSFARIFFRNAINIGLPILECPEAVDAIEEGDEIVVEPTAGQVHNLSRGMTYQAEPFPDFLQQIIDRGGLLAYVEEKLAKSRGEALQA